MFLNITYSLSSVCSRLSGVSIVQSNVNTPNSVLVEETWEVESVMC